MRILLIEDNLTIVKGLKYSLENNNFEFDYKTSISEAKKYLENKRVDLIILDIGLPDGNGIDFFEDTIQAKKISTLFLTANDDEETIVKALDIGAEDYITKPFSTKELLARINKIWRNSRKQTVIQIKDIKFDMDKMIVYKNETPVKLTSLELKILNLLFLNINKIVSRNVILDKIWEWTGNDVDDHTVTVYLRRIREKLGTDIITTIKGMGYIINYEK